MLVPLGSCSPDHIAQWVARVCQKVWCEITKSCFLSKDEKEYEKEYEEFYFHSQETGDMDDAEQKRVIVWGSFFQSSSEEEQW